MLLGYLVVVSPEEFVRVLVMRMVISEDANDFSSTTKSPLIYLPLAIRKKAFLTSKSKMGPLDLLTEYFN